MLDMDRVLGPRPRSRKIAFKMGLRNSRPVCQCFRATTSVTVESLVANMAFAQSWNKRLGCTFRTSGTQTRLTAKDFANMLE